MPTTAIDDLLADARFPADRNELLTHATSRRARGDQLAVLSTLPDRRFANRREVTEAITPPDGPGGVRAALAAALSMGTALGAARTVFRLVRAHSLGPFGLLLAGGQALMALIAAAKAVGRWRAARRRTRASR